MPISLGAPRVEKDNKKLDCDVFDIVVNEAYLKSIEENQQKYQIGFMVSVGLQGSSFQILKWRHQVQASANRFRPFARPSTSVRVQGGLIKWALV